MEKLHSGYGPSSANGNVRYHHDIMISSHSYSLGGASKNLLIFSR